MTLTARPSVKRAVSRDDFKKAFSVRVRVFVREQRVPREIEMDEDDEKATHFLACLGDRVVGTARLVIRRREAKIGRMAVLKGYRGKGLGKMLLRRTVSTARKKGAALIFLHSQVPVVGFYEQMGFCCVGRTFLEAGILHRKMVLAVDPT